MNFKISRIEYLLAALPRLNTKDFLGSLPSNRLSGPSRFRVEVERIPFRTGGLRTKFFRSSSHSMPDVSRRRTSGPVSKAKGTARGAEETTSANHNEHSNRSDSSRCYCCGYFPHS